MSSPRAHDASFADTMPSDLDLDVEAERVVGPLHGYHVACYSVPADDGFYAYAKVYTEPLSCVWNTPSPVAKYAAGPFATGDLAIEAVVQKCDVEAVVQKCDVDLRQRVSKANRLTRWLARGAGRGCAQS
jgi:hypothetical protein